MILQVGTFFPQEIFVDHRWRSLSDPPYLFSPSQKDHERRIARYIYYMYNDIYIYILHMYIYTNVFLLPGIVYIYIISRWLGFPIFRNHHPTSLRTCRGSRFTSSCPNNHRLDIKSLGPSQWPKRSSMQKKWRVRWPLRPDRLVERLERSRFLVRFFWRDFFC